MRPATAHGNPMDVRTRAADPVFIAVASAVSNEIALYRADSDDGCLQLVERLSLAGGVTR